MDEAAEYIRETETLIDKCLSTHQHQRIVNVANMYAYVNNHFPAMVIRIITNPSTAANTRTVWLRLVGTYLYKSDEESKKAMELIDRNTYNSELYQYNSELNRCLNELNNVHIMAKMLVEQHRPMFEQLVIHDTFSQWSDGRNYMTQHLAKTTTCCT
jgi:hypothetical protein